MSENLVNVDHQALRVNQILIILVSLVGFLFNVWVLPLIAGIVMLLGTIFAKPGFFPVYLLVRKTLPTDVHLDNPEPHRFAQGFGSVVLLVGSLFLAVFQWAVAGWILVGVVVALAALNAFGGFCVGCFVYYQLAKLRWPGFHKTAPAGVFPGFKPGKS